MAEFPHGWFPETNERLRLAKMVTLAHWGIIRDDATIHEIRAAAFSTVDALVPESHDLGPTDATT